MIAGESAKFKLVFARQLGIISDLGSSWMLPNLVGRARANGMALLGDDLSAEKAAEWGLIWEVLPDDKLMETATAYAERLADGAITGIKASVRPMIRPIYKASTPSLIMNATCNTISATSRFSPKVCALLSKNANPISAPWKPSKLEPKEKR